MSGNSHTEKGFFTVAKAALIAGGAMLAFTAATPAAVAGDISSISIDGLNFDFDNEDLLQSLIEMDADDIAEMREELAEARVEIRDAIGEIAEARAEAEDSDEARAILAVALSQASKSVEDSITEAFGEVRAELDRAEGELSGMKSTLSSAEYAETNDLIAFLRSELVEFEVAIAELVTAMKA